MRIVDFLKRGTMVEIIGSPVSKAFQHEDGSIRSEIRLNVSKTNILRPASREDELSEDLVDNDDDSYETSLDDFTMDEDDF
jgi:hypothetical protein